MIGHVGPLRFLLLLRQLERLFQRDRVTLLAGLRDDLARAIRDLVVVGAENVHRLDQRMSAVAGLEVQHEQVLLVR